MVIAAVGVSLVVTASTIMVVYVVVVVVQGCTDIVIVTKVDMYISYTSSLLYLYPQTSRLSNRIHRLCALSPPYLL